VVSGYGPAISHYFMSEAEHTHNSGSSDMSSDPSKSLREFFLQAAEIEDADARRAFLSQVSGQDTVLRRRLEELLAADEFAGPAPSAEVGTGSQASETVGSIIGRYKLREKIGEGGCGVVYVAEQEEPVRRRVALKIIKLGMDTRSVIARFEAERQALALMDHPNIAKVLDAGATETGRPYFVMELVPGTRITDYCDQSQLSTRARLDLFIKVCQAIQHSHQKGIIHRDLKRSNILVTVNDGVAVPKVIDFGIAKATEGRLTEKTIYTELHQFIGTPAYMSPEQAELTSLDIDTRSDIYSLGVLLYELLTGRTPIDQQELLKAGLDAMRQTIRTKEPPRPSTQLSTLAAAELSTVAKARQSDPPKLIYSVRGDLDWIVMKCLEKDRAQRYETANGLARDLQRHLHNEPVTARSPSNLYRLRKFVRRNQLLCGACSAVAAALVLGIIVSAWEAARARRAEQQQSLLRSESEAARRQVEAAREQAVMTLKASDFADAERLLKTDDAADAAAHLSRILQVDPGNRAALSQLVTLLTYHSWCVPMLVLKHADRVVFARFSPDGQRIATASADAARLWDATTGQPLAEPLKHDGPVYSAQFSRDGKRILTASADHTARVWDAQTGLEVMKLRHEDEVAEAQFSFDGQLIATGSADTVQVWDAQTGQPLGQPMRHQGHVKCVEFSPDGRRVATASTDHTARVWDARTGLPVTPSLWHSNYVYAIRFSPDGTHVLTASVDQTARLWDARTGQSVGAPMPHDALVYRAEFSPDGQRIVTASDDGTAQLWDARTGQSLTGPLRHGHRVRSAQFSPEGELVVTASADGTARVWDARTGQPLTNPMRHGDDVLEAVFSPDGKRILTCSYDGTARVWDAQMARAATLSLENPELLPARFSPDGKRVVTISGASAKVWDARTGQMLTVLSGHRAYVYCAEFSPDGKRIATASLDHTARVWDAQTGVPVTEALEHNDRVFTARFSPDGLRLVTASWDKTGKIWDAQTGHNITTLQGHSDYLIYAEFSPDGRLVATASWDKTARIWDAHTGLPVSKPLQHKDRVWFAKFSPDSKHVVTASDDGTARVWDATTSQPLTPPLQHKNQVWYAEFSPDGARVVTASANKTARVWDANTGQPLTEPMVHDYDVFCARFSPDGARILTSSDVTPILTNTRLRTSAPHAQFSPDGSRLLIASDLARLWDAHTGQPLTELITSSDNAAHVWDAGFVPSTLPDWLLPLAEAISGRRLNKKGLLEESSIDRPKTIAQTRRYLADQPDSGDGVKWGRWLLSNPVERAISPLSTLPTATYIENQIKRPTTQSLEEAAGLAFGDAELLRRISEARNQLEKMKGPIEAGKPNTK